MARRRESLKRKSLKRIATFVISRFVIFSTFTGLKTRRDSLILGGRA